MSSPTVIQLIPFTNETFDMSVYEDMYQTCLKAKYYVCNSYKEAMMLLQMYKANNLTIETLLIKLKFEEAHDIEYMFPLWLMSPYAIDLVGQIVRTSIAPICATVNKWRSTMLARKAIEFIDNIDLSVENVDSPTEVVKKIATERITENTDLLINPFIMPMTKHESTTSIINSIEVSKAKDPQFLQHSRAAYVKMFHSYTYNLMKDFPFNAAIVAGGFIEKLLSCTVENFAGTDVDIFVIGTGFADKSANFNKILDFFDNINTNGTRVYFVNKGSVVNVFVEGISRSFQIISGSQRNIYDILNGFDMSHIQWAFDGTDFFGTSAAATSLETRVTAFVRDTKQHLKRAVKALIAGYKISANYITKHTNLEERLGLMETVTQVVKSARIHWFPMSSAPGVAPEDLEEYNINMCAHMNGGTCHLTSATSRENTKIGANFDSAYDIINISEFNPHIVDVIRNLSAKLKTANAPINFGINDAVLSGTRRQHGQITLNVFISDTLRAFIDQIKTIHSTRFNRRVNVDFDGGFSYADNKDIIKSHINEPLTADALVVGSIITILFTVKLSSWQPNIEFIPWRILVKKNDNLENVVIPADEQPEHQPISPRSRSTSPIRLVADVDSD